MEKYPRKIKRGKVNAADSMGALYFQMEKDKKLQQLLTTPYEKLNPLYRNLIGEVLPQPSGNTLLFAIEETVRVLPNDQVFFSRDENGKLVGFFAFVENGEEVTNMKTFSFILPGFNNTLVRDLIDLLDLLIPEYEKVSWIALKRNPVIKAYEKIATERGGYSVSFDNDKIRFTVPGTKQAQLTDKKDVYSEKTGLKRREADEIITQDVAQLVDNIKNSLEDIIDVLVETDVPMWYITNLVRLSEQCTGTQWAGNHDETYDKYYNALMKLEKSGYIKKDSLLYDLIYDCHLYLLNLMGMLAV